MNIARLPYNYLVLFLINSFIDVFSFPWSSAVVDLLLPPNTTFYSSSNTSHYSQWSLKLLM